MNRNDLKQYILDAYGVDLEYPWIQYPDYAVYRHQANRKWFAVIMGIPQSKLGMDGNEIIHVVNLKCDPMLLGSMTGHAGIYPGYHMNKGHWITVCLDGRVENDMIRWLMNMSFDLTKGK